MSQCALASRTLSSPFNAIVCNAPFLAWESGVLTFMKIQKRTPPRNPSIPHWLFGKVRAGPLGDGPDPPPDDGIAASAGAGASRSAPTGVRLLGGGFRDGLPVWLILPALSALYAPVKSGGGAVQLWEQPLRICSKAALKLHCACSICPRLGSFRREAGCP